MSDTNTRKIEDRVISGAISGAFFGAIRGKIK
jgi:hypothetical protein